MLQAPFGTAGSGWMALSSPGVGWLPPQPGSVSSPLTSTPLYSGFGAAPSVEGGGVSGATPFMGQAPASGLAQSSVGWGMVSPGQTPLSTPFSIPDGITAVGLLAGIGVRRGQPQGPTSDQDVEEFVYDALELLPGAGDVEVRCEGGRVTLTGSVPHKRLKRDIGEIAWAIPGIADVQNTVSITTRRRSRTFTREAESPPASAAGRKQA